MTDRLLEQANRLAAAIARTDVQDPARRPSQPVTRRKARVTAVGAGGRVDVDLNGTPLANVPVHRHLTPLVGDEVWVDLLGGMPQASTLTDPPSWLLAVLVNGASNAGSPFALASYAGLPGGMVGLKGRVVVGAAGVNQPMFVLPPELRPTSDRWAVCSAFNGSAWVAGMLYVNRRSAGTNPGAVHPAVATNGQPLGLDGVSFSIY